MKSKHNNSFITGVKKRLSRDTQFLRLVVILIILFAAVSIFRPERFLSIDNFQAMASQFPEFGMMSLGIMLTMIIGGIDLSVVGVANLTAIIAAKFLLMSAPEGALESQKILAIILAIAAGMASGAICGFINGNLVSRIGIPPILATLGSMQLFTGVAIIITEGRTISRLPLLYSKIVRTNVFGFIPLSLVVFILAVIIIGIVLKRTTYGMSIYMMGSNPTASKFSGLNNVRLTNRTYTYSGFLASIGGLIMLANYNSAKPDYGSAYTLQCILIVVLGGVNPDGGYGKVGGVAIAILILQILSSGLNMFPTISNFYRPLIWGTVLLIVMVVNYVSGVNQTRKASKN